MIKSKISIIIVFFTLIQITEIYSQVIFDNGPLKTGTTSLSGVAVPTSGYEWSEVPYDAPTITYSSTTGGISGLVSSAFRLGDDFTIPSGETWIIDSLTVYAYQTGYNGSTSPFTGLNVQLWNGYPNAMGSTLVFGDLVTNRLTSSTEDFTYRIFNTIAPAPGTATTTTRRIWKLNANITDQTLSSGTYWLVYQYTASAGFSPTVSLLNSRTIAGANAIQFNTVWSAVLDTGSPLSAADVNVELPFKLYGISNNYVTINGIEYNTIEAALAAVQPNETIIIHEDISSAANNVIPSNVTIQINDGVSWNSNFIVTNNGTITEMGTGSFDNTGGTYKGNGTYTGDFVNNGTVSPGN